jgi:hypothetical protein
MNKPWPPGLSTAANVVAFIAFLLLVAFISMPNSVRSNHSKTNSIINNLRQIDGALQQWAFEHGQTNAVTIAKEDITPYLRRPPPWINPVAGEIYIIKGVTEPPEAQLTRDLPGHPKGTVFRFTTNGQPEIIFPNKAP